MEEVLSFLKDCGTYYLATEEGNQPRVRPFGTVAIFEGHLYIQTGKKKDVFKQIEANNNVELCSFKDGKWIRVAGKLLVDDRGEAKKYMLDNYPELITPREVKAEGLLVLTSNKGLAGAYNNNVIKAAFKRIQENKENGIHFLNNL